MSGPPTPRSAALRGWAARALAPCACALWALLAIVSNASAAAAGPPAVMPLTVMPLTVMPSAGAPSASAAQHAGADATLAPAMAAELRRQRLAGAVWAWTDRTGAVHLGAAGQRNAATGEAMTAQTRVNVGSITKTLVAVGLLRLASQGRIDLDAPVEPQLGGLRFDNPWRAERPVTLRHLLDHTAGLEDARLWQVFSQRAGADSPLRQAFPQDDPSLLRVRTAPGERFSYSNMGYALAAIALESAAGERYETWLQRELLQPLGMAHSRFEFVRQDRSGGEDLAWGHLDDLRPYPSQAMWLRPAGQFTTTAGDMARLAAFLLGDGQAGGRLLVDPRLLRQMGRPGSTAAARAGLDAGYALGLARQERQGAVGLCHSGSIVGYHAMFCLYPDHRQAFFIAHNSDAENADYGRFDALLVRAMGLPPATAAAVAPPPADLAQWQGRYVIDPSRFAPFRYTDLLSNTLRLRPQTAGGLRLEPMQGQARLLRPVGGRLFAAEDRRRPSHVLLQQDGGARLISDGFKTYRELPSWQFWGLWANLALGAAGLAWFLLGTPLRLARRRRPWPVPGALGAALLVVPAPLFALQSFMALGDRTPASLALYLATAALAPLMLWQLWRSLRQRPAGWADRADAAAAAAVLQWCLVLAAWGLLPFALWR